MVWALGCDGAHRFLVENTSVSTLEKSAGAGAWMVAGVNNISHLQCDPKAAVTDLMASAEDAKRQRII